jgi:undecaprenyl-diphosphatase
MSFDKKYSGALYTSASNNKWMALVARLGASNLIWLMFGFALAYYYESFLFVFPPVILAWGISLLVSEIVKRPRPFQEYGFKPLINLAFKTGSFPSEHATIAFAIAALFTQDVFLTLSFILAAVVVALSRVAAGVHYLSDILVGGLIGFLVAKAAVIAMLLFL